MTNTEKTKISQIQQVRERLGLSTSQLAHRMGISQSSVVRLEQSERRGTISISSLKRATEALGCKFSYRVTLPKDKNPSSNREYPGLPRMYRAGHSNPSELALLLKEEEQRFGRMSDPVQRIRRACEMSDLLRSFR